VASKDGDGSRGLLCLGFHTRSYTLLGVFLQNRGADYRAVDSK
jgi:hypothetical protein